MNEKMGGVGDGGFQRRLVLERGGYQVWRNHFSGAAYFFTVQCPRTGEYWRVFTPEEVVRILDGSPLRPVGGRFDPKPSEVASKAKAPLNPS